jgi:multicomponent Na+:H+ antiporter subunit D
MISFPPFLPFFIGAAAMLVLPPRLRPALSVAVPLLGGWNLYGLADGLTVIGYGIGDFSLVLLRPDALSFFFGLLFHVVFLIAAVFAFHVVDRRRQATAMLYAGSALGAVFAGDLMTLFVFWELLALTSFFIVLGAGEKRRRDAAVRYLVLQVISGLLLLGGILARYSATGTLAFTEMRFDGSLASGLILAAFAIKCGFPLLHAWIVDAYPEADATDMVFLSAFSTKVAIYALARGFPETELLIYLGAAMTIFPIFFAVIENDLRRVLCYSMINQLGFMVCGIGLGSDLAIGGALAHAFNDSLFKALLLMSMGAVLAQTGTAKASELGGLSKAMPWTTGFCLVGAASISAFPLFSGFISKSMIMTAALEQGHLWIWLLLLFASAGVMEHAGIKIPFFAFFAHDSGKRPAEAPKHMLAAMGLAAALSIFIGLSPRTLYALLPLSVSYEPYTTDHVVQQFQLLLFAILAFCFLWMKGIYPPELDRTNLDVDWLYRRALPRLWRGAAAMGQDVSASFGLARDHLASSTAAFFTRHAGPGSRLGGSWSIEAMVAVVVALLGLTLALTFF